MTLERKAIEQLRTRGHCKGMLSNPRWEVCALGALYSALYGVPVYGHQDVEETHPEVMQRLHRIVEEQYPDRLAGVSDDGYSILSAFNDHPDTTTEDVERVFTKSAIEAEEQI